MLVDLSFAIMHVTVSIAILQLEVSAALIPVTVSTSNMWVTIFIVLMQVWISVAFMKVVISAVHNCFYCKMQVTVSVIAIWVTLSMFYIHFSNWHHTFHKIDKKTFNGIISGCLFTSFVNIFLKLRVEIMYNSVKRVFQYFFFPDRIIKGGDNLDF